MEEKSKAVLEIACDSIESLIIAQTNGADRIELCQGLEVGGLTPSAGLIKKAKELVSIPIFMMIRPRSGDFFYNKEEVQMMLIDIELGVSLGVDGFVTGALEREKTHIEKDACVQFIKAAKGKPVTFHRAFDVMNCDVEEALEEIINAGFTRVLTSGRKATAKEGVELIAKLVKKARERIIIMPGSGVNMHTINYIANLTEASEFHSSGRINKTDQEDASKQEDASLIVQGAAIYQCPSSFNICKMASSLMSF